MHRSFKQTILVATLLLFSLTLTAEVRDEEKVYILTDYLVKEKSKEIDKKLKALTPASAEYKALEAEKGLKEEAKLLSEIIRDLISDKETQSEILRKFGWDLKGDVGASKNFLTLAMAKINFAAEFERRTQIAERIRTRIKVRLNDIIDNFNEKLRHIRRSIQKQNKGRDILFIIDGMEKVSPQVYEDLIVRDHIYLRNINANIILSFPIEAQYRPGHKITKDNFDTFLLPVIRIDDLHNRILLSNVINKRISIDKFFESEEVLDYLVQMSGGLIRQLFKLVSFCLLYSDEPKVTLREAQEIAEEYGRMMYETLNTKQLKVLKELKSRKKELKPANDEDGLLLFNLFVLKFQGDYIINPVIDRFV